MNALAKHTIEIIRVGRNVVYSIDKINPTKQVAINMRSFEGLAFNLGIAILTEKGLPQFIKMWKDFKNRQVYISANSVPMVGIVFGAFEKTSN
jgi:hypothetical protein